MKRLNPKRYKQIKLLILYVQYVAMGFGFIADNNVIQDQTNLGRPSLFLSICFIHFSKLTQ